jgi:hypothetical protein
VTGEELNPKALAEWSDEAADLEENIRPGVQPVDEEMILNYVLRQNELPEESARPFAEWINQNWYQFSGDDQDNVTNGDVIEGALLHWCGGRIMPGS